MSQEIIDRIRAGYETLSRTGEYDPELLAADFELHSSLIDIAGVFQGRDGLRDVLRELRTAFDELSYVPDEKAVRLVVFDEPVKALEAVGLSE